MKNKQLPYVKEKGISVTEYLNGKESLLPWVKMVEKGWLFGNKITIYYITESNPNNFHLTDYEGFKRFFYGKSSIEVEEILDECIRNYFSYKSSTTIVNKYEISL